jgi:hypothetical protein
LNDNLPQKQKKSRAERRAERLAKREERERFRIRGESRGWQIKSSSGMPVWQFIRGGAFQPLPETE